MSDNHDFLASDGGVPMIYRRNPRIVANACLGCGLSLNACQATRELESEPCCLDCNHGG